LEHRPPGDNTFFPGILGSSHTALGLALALRIGVSSFETDGSVLMNTAPCARSGERPANLTVLVVDNGIYENIGGPPTHTSRNTDLAKMAEGGGCINVTTVRDVSAALSEFKRMLEDSEMGYIVAKIEPGKFPWAWKDRKPTDGVEDKYRFMRHVEKLENIVIHPGAPQN
jgi:thiamine pyrophosphate-dependent acetolactate synthase large subunit-like protein